MSVEQDNIIVRRYVNEDYSDLFQAGYPFDQDLRPDIRNRLTNLLDRKQIEQALIRTILPLDKEEIFLVAHSPKNGKTIGVMTCRRITDNLWGIWDVFVSPSSRGRGIASILYQKAFELLRKKNVKKTAVMVFLDNVASLRSIQKNWEGYLPTRIFAFKGSIRINRDKLATAAVTKLQEGKKNLFEIFEHCVGEQWRSFLEFNEDNFLDRVCGPGFIEPVRKNLLTKLVIKDTLFAAESKGKIEGYAISRTDRFEIVDRSTYYILRLFVPLSDNFPDVFFALLSKAADPSRYQSIDAVCIGNVRVQNHLKKLGFEVREGLVWYKHLQ